MVWFALFAGPLAWALRQLVSYALVRPACASGAETTLVATAVAMLALAMSGVVAGGVCLARARGGRQEGGMPVDRARFMATVAVWLDLLVTLLLTLSLVSEWVLSPCE